MTSLCTSATSPCAWTTWLAPTAGRRRASWRGHPAASTGPDRERLDEHRVDLQPGLQRDPGRGALRPLGRRPRRPRCARPDRRRRPDDPDDVPDGVPDYVELALATLENVWAQEIGVLGYRAPLSDITSNDNGLDARFDVYLDDVGDDFVFGYCTTDDPNRESTEIFAVSAYCVLDNDYHPSQFGTAHSPQEFLEVTAAHEFHHASQFAYDWQEDVWLLEGTATNMEETVYPLIDDNVFFLDYFSPLTHPAVSLDRGGFGDSEYGAWIYWRYLQEKVAARRPGHPARDLGARRQRRPRGRRLLAPRRAQGAHPARPRVRGRVRTLRRREPAPRLRRREHCRLPGDPVVTDMGPRPQPARRDDAVLEDQPPRDALLLVRPRQARLEDREAPALDHAPALRCARLARHRAHGQLGRRAVPEAERVRAVEPADRLRARHDQARRPRPLQRQHADWRAGRTSGRRTTRASAGRWTTAARSPSARSSPSSTGTPAENAFGR